MVKQEKILFLGDAHTSMRKCYHFCNFLYMVQKKISKVKLKQLLNLGGGYMVITVLFFSSFCVSEIFHNEKPGIQFNSTRNMIEFLLAPRQVPYSQGAHSLITTKILFEKRGHIKGFQCSAKHELIYAIQKLKPSNVAAVKKVTLESST